MERTLTSAQQHALDFLRTHLPQSDLDSYDEALFLLFVDHALALRESAPWCAALDEEIFFHYVLFPRVNDEDLSFHREIFRAALWERIVNLPTTAEKILEVNRWCHENASYQMQDDRTASPLTVYRCGSGRCGEESAFLVSALRSVGIPARQVYSPRWAHCDDNHAWVEALCDGQWRFLGACEPEPILDRGWFNSPASRAMLVHSRVFGAAEHPLHGEEICTEGVVTWLNQTARYALTRRRTLRAVIDGYGVACALIEIKVLNEASFHTIATLLTDRNGEATIELGLGNFHIFARYGEYTCEKTGTDEDVITLEMQDTRPLALREHDWYSVDYIAPLDAPINASPLSDTQKRERAATLAQGRAMREARIEAMFPERAEDQPYADLLRAARGNAAEIEAFLTEDSDPRREAMLRSLSKKDLRDVTADILNSHLRALAPQGSLPDDVYIPYVLCPRIEREPLTAWREELISALQALPADPKMLYSKLPAYVRVSLKNTYASLVTPPAKAWRAKRCNGRSQNILYVALLRTMGIPARLRALDGELEYYRDGEWVCVLPAPTAKLHLFSDTDAVYRQNWSLSRCGYTWHLQHLESETWTDSALHLTLPEGQYRLTTSVRMPNGNQFAAHRDFMLLAGSEKSIDLTFRSYELTDLLRCQRLPVMSAETENGGLVEDICRADGRPTILLWLEEGGEPTEHILNELLDMQRSIISERYCIRFLLRSSECAKQRTISLALEHLPFVEVLLDDWAYDLEMTARHLTCDPDTPPLAVVCDGDANAVFGMSGYHVGSAQLLVRIAKYLA